MLPHQVERLRRVNAMPKVSYAFRGAAAAMVGASVIIGTNIPDPNSVMMANILDAGNVPGQPVYAALHIGEIEAPRVVETQNELAAFEPQKSMRVDTLPVAVRPGAGIVVADMRASRVMPTTRAASRMDAIVAHAGGFHVFVGLQANFTQGVGDGVNRGQIVFIDKPAVEQRQIARLIDGNDIRLPFPEQFRLTELEMSSFSRP
jgi:hypothetical protein